jgi:type II secretory pathway component GspD/PulD (secretin)
MNNRLRRFAALAITCCAMAAPALVRGQAEAPARAAPREERINVNFRATPIEEVFDMLSRKDGTNIILSKGVTGTVSVNLYNVTVKEAIHRVAQASGYWVVEERNGDFIVYGKDASLDYPGSGTRIRTFKVQYSDVKQVADILSKYVSRQGKVTPLVGRKLIVVEDLPGFAERVGKLLEELDVPPKQVMIEAKILEISLDDTERYGIDWRRVFGSPTGTHGSFGASGLASGSASAPGQGFFFSILNRNVEAFLSALATKGRVRTLATPKLLALENQEAKTVIGDSTGYRVTTTINLVTTESIQFLESGVILKVTPSVDQRGRVLMRVHPEVSAATLSAGIPSKKSTEVTTELVCEDGKSIFIGGLIKAGSLLESQGVPLAQDVPVLGALFRNNFQSAVYTETIVLITPYVISEPQADAFSADKVRQVEEASDLIREHQQRLQRQPQD